ncbi:MAG: hypothetical protein Q9209_006777 [Squamulea sp. 1 TL-2023]
MARKRKKLVHHLDERTVIQKSNPASSTARPPPARIEVSIHQAKGDTMSSKFSTPREFTKHDPRPTKRVKTNAGSGIPSTSVAQSLTTQDPTYLTKTAPTESARTTNSIPPEVQHLQEQYDISSLSIISSSKIYQKVTTLIARVEKFTFANVKAKPGIVVLRAKAASASKMISVVEIAKADIANRGGNWYEYSKLGSELLHYREKQNRQPLAGRTFGDVASERNVNGNGSSEPQTTVTDDEEDQLGAEGDNSEDGEAAFETFQHQSLTTVNGRSRVRATPIMTIYFACVPVPGLKALLG